MKQYYEVLFLSHRPRIAVFHNSEIQIALFVFWDLGKDQRTVQEHNYSMEERQIVTLHADHRCTGSQGAKKIIFTACHSGKLKLAFTSPDVISASPKSFFTSRIDFTVLLLFEFLKKHHFPIGQVKNRID